MIRATLEHAGEVYTGTAETIEEALDVMPITYNDIKYKGTITIEKGEKKVSRFLYKRPLRLIFSSKLKKSLIIHQLNDLLDE